MCVERLAIVLAILFKIARVGAVRHVKVRCVSGEFYKVSSFRTHQAGLFYPTTLVVVSQEG